MKLLFSCLMLSVASSIYAQNPVKWCILEKEKAKCEDMKIAFANNGLPAIQCVQAAHEAACLRMIQDEEADIRSVTDRGIFVGGKFNSLMPIVSEKRTGTDAASFFYKAVVVVKTDGGIAKITDLKGKRSCHTAVMRTVGWVIPMGILYNHANMPLSSAADSCDNNIKSVSEFFTQSCAPGAYDHYNNPNSDNPPNICAQCANTSCPTDDKYAGYVGAFRGLVDGQCDVAFVKHDTTNQAKMANITFTANSYRLVCPDGTLKPVTAWDSCHWGIRPTPAVMTRGNVATQTYVDLLERADGLFGVSGSKRAEFSLYDSSKYGDSNLIFHDATKQLSEIATKGYKEHLGDGYLNSYENFRPASCKKTFRWCVTSDVEMKKCRDFSGALGGRRMTLDLTCVMGQNADDCMMKIKDNKADTITVDGGHVYTGGAYFNLKPIMAEVYDNVQGDTSYYAVAVTMKTKTGFTLNTLRGRKTCHTGFERTSGWNVPIGYFANRNDFKIDPATCNAGLASSGFFGDMCVPGALEREYNHGKNNPAKLCALCNDDCKHTGIYSGYTGAIRCLKVKDADVAFVKHTTIDDILKISDSWASGLKKEDFELLCRDGSRKAVSEYESCNLARVPSHAVLTSKDRSDSRVRHYQVALDRAQMKYNKKNDGTPMDPFFSMFVSNGKDLLFKDSTIRKKKKVPTATLR